MILILLILLAVPVYGQFSTQLSGPVTIVGGALNVASGTTSPSGTLGSVFANTSVGSLQIHNGTGWTNALGYTGALDKNVRLAYDGNAWVTEFPTYGEIYTPGGGSVTVTNDPDTLLNMSNSGELSSFVREGRFLKYTGSYAIRALVNFHVAAEGQGSTVLYIAVIQNSTKVDKTEVTGTAVDANDVYALSGSSILVLQPNDKISLVASSDTNGTGFTFQNVNLVITKL